MNIFVPKCERIRSDQICTPLRVYFQKVIDSASSLIRICHQKKIAHKIFARDVLIPNTRDDTIDTRVLISSKVSILARNIDCFDTSEPAIFFVLISGLIMKMIPKSLNWCKYYKSSSFSMVLKWSTGRMGVSGYVGCNH